MSVTVFLLLVFGFLAIVGGVLAGLGYRKIYWALIFGITALFAISVVAAWRPSTDDPIPSLMFLVIGLYGSLAGGAGMLTGLIVSNVMKARRGST